MGFHAARAEDDARRYNITINQKILFQFKGIIFYDEDSRSLSFSIRNILTVNDLLPSYKTENQGAI